MKSKNDLNWKCFNRVFEYNNSKALTKFQKAENDNNNIKAEK